MRLTLISIDCFAPSLELAVDGLPCVIGSDPRVDVCLTDRGVGQRHCELLTCDGGLIVRTMKSRHEVLVNGQSVTDAVLQSGDTLTVGIRSLQISYGNPQKRGTGEKQSGRLPAGRATVRKSKAAVPELT